MKATEKDWERMDRVLAYINGTRGQTLELEPYEEPVV
eukprot:gene16638-16452_t